MNEQPKKRGRPSKADIAARGPAVNSDTRREPEDVIARAMLSDDPFPRLERAAVERAQTYAMRIWSGQSASLKRAERIARCEIALQGQNLPTEGVKYPVESGDDWTEEDYEPVSWRGKLPKPEGIV
jgi:hypothetical protein